MARNDGVDRTCARNMDVTDNDIGDAQAHNEREKEIYSNEDIIPERSSLNVHFKEPTGSYAEMFEQMKADNIISTKDAKVTVCVIPTDEELAIARETLRLVQA